MAVRRKTDALDVPETLTGAQELLAQIGAADRAIEHLAARGEARIAEIKEEFGAAIDIKDTENKERFRALSAYVQANKIALIAQDRESVEWPQGRVGFRLTPFSVTLGKGKDDAILAALEAHDAALINVTRKIDKQAVLKDFAALPVIDGLSRGRKREFYAKPTDSKTERKKTIPQPKVKQVKLKPPKSTEGASS